MERLLGAAQWSSAKLVALDRFCEECKQPLVKEEVQSCHAKRREGRRGAGDKTKGSSCAFEMESRENRYTHFFLPSVLTCIGVPLRDGSRKREPGLTVSLDFQLSVLAEL